MVSLARRSTVVVAICIPNLCIPNADIGDGNHPPSAAAAVAAEPFKIADAAALSALSFASSSAKNLCGVRKKAAGICIFMVNIYGSVAIESWQC